MRIFKNINSASVRSSYLHSLSFIYFIAFLSFYHQYPGLLSNKSGIIPVDRVLPKSFPRLYSGTKIILLSLLDLSKAFDLELDVDALDVGDVLCQVLALTGISLSLAVTL